MLDEIAVYQCSDGGYQGDDDEDACRWDYQLFNGEAALLSDAELFACPALKTEVAYDCMWNGHTDDRRSKDASSASPPVSLAPVEGKPPVAQVPGQSVLKTNCLSILADPNIVMPMPPTLNALLQTPPISDDEETKPTQVLRNLQTALNENDLDEFSDFLLGAPMSLLEEDFDEDLDLGDLLDQQSEDEEFEQEEEEEEEDVKPDIEEVDLKPVLEDLRKKEQEENQKRAFYAASDHSYHKGMAPVHQGNLGIETPSDSEEEIDVVSLDKFSMTKSIGGSALPTNPSTQDRRHIQRTMQSRFPQGLKTLMPVRRAAAAAAAKKVAAPEKPRQYKRVKGNHKQHKRRYRMQSTDSEHEPSEKRHLHNNMERQRRIDLRNLFNELKRVVPEVNRKPRAAKVQILRGAAAHIESVKNKHAESLREYETLKRKQQFLRTKLAKLRRAVAAQR